MDTTPLLPPADSPAIRPTRPISPRQRLRWNHLSPTVKAIMKRLLIPALLASSAFVLSGCLDVDADLSVNEDATATGEMTIAISSEISGLLGLGSGVDLVDQLKQGMLDGAEGSRIWTASPQIRNAVAMVCSFENQVFDQADDIWNIYASDDNTITFYSSSGEQAAEEDAGFLDDLVDFDFGGYQIDVEMPARSSVSMAPTWIKHPRRVFASRPSLNDSFEAVVVSEDGSSSFPWVLLIVIGVAVLAVIALVAFLIGRSRSSGDSDVQVIRWTALGSPSRRRYRATGIDGGDARARLVYSHPRWRPLRCRRPSNPAMPLVMAPTEMTFRATRQTTRQVIHRQTTTAVDPRPTTTTDRWLPRANSR